jgi:outer membrane protein
MKNSKSTTLFLACILAASFFSAAAPASGEAVRLTLEEAIALGLENSTAIASKRAAVAAAQEDIKAARAEVYPSVSAGLSWTQLVPSPEALSIPAGAFGPGLPPADVGLGSSPSSLVSPSVDVSQVVTTFGKAKNGLALAEQGAAQAVLALEEEKRRLVVQISEAFYGYLLAEEVLRINEATFASKQDALEVARIRYEAGVVADFEVLRAESDLESFRSNVISAANNVRIALLNVQNALGIEGEDVDVELVGELQRIPVELDRDRLIAQALASKYELLSFRKTIDIQKAQDRLNRSLRLPTLVAWANYQLQGGFTTREGWGQLVDDDNWDGTLSFGLNLSVPVSVWFPWSKETVANRKTAIQLQDLELQYQSLVSGIRLAVESSILKIAEEEAKIASGRKSVELAQRLYDSAVEQYEGGYISSTDLRDVQLSLNAARLGYAQAVFGYNQNVLALMDAVGVAGF